MELKNLLCLMKLNQKVLLKSVAINNEKGGPKTTQHRNAIKQSASTKVTILFF